MGYKVNTAAFNYNFQVVKRLRLVGENEFVFPGIRTTAKLSLLYNGPVSYSQLNPTKSISVVSKGID